MLSSALTSGVRLAVVLTVSSALWSSRAHAFTEPRTYYDSAAKGGGGGRFFTGSPAEGHGCAVCHTGPAKNWPVQISGLPQAGYEPGAQYDLTLRWPELAEHAAELRADNDIPPAMSVVVELLAESGEGAGTVELTPMAETDEEEQCVVPAGKIAAQLYSVKPGDGARQSGERCDAVDLGQRCIAATLSCGARALRLRWTAPESAQGPIWLSGGLVATDAASGNAEDDAVTAIRHVMLPAGSSAEHAESRLRAGCSAAGTRGSRGALAPLAWLALLAITALWRLRRARASLRAWVVTALALGACNASPEAPFTAADGGHPRAGLYTPGNRIGAPPIDRDASADAIMPMSNPLEDAINEATGTERCVNRDETGTKGKLEFSFFSASYGGFYAPENCGVAWIEDADGNYVATPLMWTALRARNLMVWDARRCSKDRPDVIASATLPDHAELHEGTWDGKDQTGRVVPDGTYVLNIEITEDEFDYGRHAEVPFEKGNVAQTLAPDDSESVKGLSLIYTPEP